MLNRISVNFILKSLITSLMSIIIIALAVGAWDSWRRLGAVSRIGAVAEATSYMFTALHNLRVDRSQSSRNLNSDKQQTAMSPLLRTSREAEMPALRAAIAHGHLMSFDSREAGASSRSQASRSRSGSSEHG